MRRVVPTPFPLDPWLQSTEQLGAAVRASRTAAGMTLEDAALAVGVAKQTLQNLETGKGQVSLTIALRILGGLGVDLFVGQARDRSRILNVLKAGETHGA